MSKGQKPKEEQPSEEFKTFRAAMKQILSVPKIEVVKDLPKMFQERLPPGKPQKKRKTNKKSDT